MKYLITISLLITFISKITYAQDLQKLDERHGFKRLILGLPLEMVKEKDKLKHLETDKKSRVAVYSVKNLSDFTISGFEPAYINLHFFKDKLMQISVKMPNQPININGVLNKAHGNLWNKAYGELLDTYGRKIERAENKIEGSHSTIWRGNVVTLFFTRYNIASDFTELGFQLDFVHNKIYGESQLVSPTATSDF